MPSPEQAKQFWLETLSGVLPPEEIAGYLEMIEEFRLDASEAIQAACDEFGPAPVARMISTKQHPVPYSGFIEILRRGTLGSDLERLLRWFVALESALKKIEKREKQ